MIRRLWMSKWAFVRLAIAGFVLWALVADTGARMARLQLASLPDFDYAAQIRALRAEGRYGEALMIAQTGLDSVAGAVRAEVEHEKQLTADEQASWLRRAREAGLGAISGSGSSLEGLAGAVAADFFVVGDLRDLVIQGTKQVLDGESDEVILSLSAVGVATTLAPEVDWVPSLMKIAKKSGAMSKRIGESVVSAVKSGEFRRLEPLARDVKSLSDASSPGGAIRLLKLADDEREVAALATFVRGNRRGAFALHVTGERGAAMIKSGGESGAGVVVKAAAKGRAGATWLGKPAARILMRPHPLLGLIKAVYKGNAEALILRLVDAMDPRAWWLVAAAAVWAWLEAALIVRRLIPRSLVSPEPEPPAD